MKKILLHTLFLSASLMAVDTPYRVSSATQYVNVLVNPIGAKYERMERLDSSFEMDADMLYSENYNILNLPMTYVYNDTVGLSIYVPIVNYRHDALTPLTQPYNETGLGDVSFGISFNAGTFEEGIESRNIFEFRYTIDSGDAKKGLGMGAQSLSILWDTMGTIDEWTLYGSLIWTIYITETDNNVRIGSDDLWWFGASHKCLLSDKVQTALKFTWQSKYYDYANSGLRRLSNTSYDVIDMTVQWSSDKLIKHVPIKAGVRIPVYSWYDVETSVNAFVGIGGLF